MERFNDKEKKIKPIEAAVKILEGMGISQLAEAELSDNGKNRKEEESGSEIQGRKHHGGSVPSVFEKLKKSNGPDKDDLGDDDLPEGYTHPMDGE